MDAKEWGGAWVVDWQQWTIGLAFHDVWCYTFYIGPIRATVWRA